MVLNTWAISGIIAAIIFILVVPAILWLRFGKKGREKFGNTSNSKTIHLQIKEISQEIKDTKQKIKTAEDLLVKAQDINQMTRHREEIKIYKKTLINLERQLDNKQKLKAK